MKKKIDTIAQYIDAAPVQTRVYLEKMRDIIREAAPGSGEKISYGIPTFYTEAGNLIHFGGFKAHVGLYPGAKAIEVFAGELEKFDVSKGTIQFQLDKPLPIGLIKKLVKYRLKEDRDKLKAKSALKKSSSNQK